MWRLLLFILIVFAFSCDNVNKGTSANFLKQDSVKTMPSEPISKPKSFHYKFDTSRGFRYNILNGWMDTFSINQRLFRLRLDSADNVNGNLTIECYKTGRWIMDAGLEYYWDFGFNDVNRDGFPDFFTTYRRWIYINFFNPAANLFDTITWDIAGISTELDSSRNINYTFWHDDAIPLYSKLYTFKGIRPYYYYFLLNQGGPGYDRYDTNKFVGLWQCRNGFIDSAYLIKKIKVAENEDGNDFDYEKFWKAHYQNLINKYTPSAPKKYYSGYKPY